MAAEQPGVVEAGQLTAATEHLTRVYAGDDGDFSEEEVREAVQDAADDLSDAPVQTFVPLIAENKARRALHDQGEHLDTEH